VKRRRLQSSAAADTEDIEIDVDRFMPFCSKFKYLGSYVVPELNDKGDITDRIRQMRRLFDSMKKQLLSNKQTPIDIRRGFIKRLLSI
jgi:hypothetical protein